MRIERHSAVVQRDLPQLYRWIAKDDPAAAERFLQAVKTEFERLSGFPESGVHVNATFSSLKGTRMLPVSGFRNVLILYRVDEEAVRILYVTHGARDIPNLHGRERRS